MVWYNGFMDIEGQVATLTDEEQALTGHEAVVMVDEIDISALLEACIRRREGLEQKRTSDDDELTHAERAAIGPSMQSELRAYTVFCVMAGQILAYQCEQSLRRPAE